MEPRSTHCSLPRIEYVMARPLTIIMYHYVRDFARTRYPNIKGLDRHEFANQLDYLQNEYELITVEDVVRAIQSGEALPSNAALLTFDDGYAEHYNLVFPMLFDRGLQGSFFPPVAPIRDSVLLDVNRVHFILACCENAVAVAQTIDNAVHENREELHLEDVSRYRETWAQPNRFDPAEVIYVKRMLQTALPEDFRNTIAKKLFAEHVSADESAFAAELYISTGQAKLMQASGMYFGSHGMSHYWLNRVPEKVQREEIKHSLEYLRAIGSPVDDYWVMCYPYGGWNENLLNVLREEGATFGLTTAVRTADLDSDDLLTLPRYDTNDFPKTAYTSKCEP